MMKVLVLIPYLHDTVPGQRFRIEQWARFLEPKGIQFHFVPFESERLKQVFHAQRHHLVKAKELLRCMARRVKELSSILKQRRWDVLYLYRELLPIGPPLLEHLLTRAKAPIVYDFDDAIFLPDVSEANRHFQWLKWPQKTGTICRLSSHVIVGNQYLREYVSRHTPEVSVIPTTIDTDRYRPKDSVEIRGRPVIGWSGSLTTLKHLKGLESTLKLLRESIPFHLKVIGSEQFPFKGLEGESRAWSAQSEREDLKSFDIGIMPLPHDAWSLGKCGLKALQYMAVGVPTVASPVGVNCEIIQDGTNGFIAGDAREWVEKVSRLVESDPLRKRFSVEGRRTVEERYSARAQAPRLLKILEQVRQSSGATFRTAVPPLEVPPPAVAANGDGERRSQARERQDILCLSSIDWDFVWQGHQEIMTTLARQGHRVLFVENTGVRNPRFQDLARIRRRLARWRRSLRGFWQREENLYIFSPLVLPFPYSRWARRINQWLLVSALKEWMQAIDFFKPILWTFLPTPLTLEVIRTVPHKLLVYYCIDSFIDSTPAARRIASSEESLLKEADLVFVTSEQLFQYASRWSQKVHLFPFGVSFQAFEQAQSLPEGPPVELRSVKRPIIGYVGGIHQWLDQELLCRAAQAHREFSFVLIGPIQTDVRELRREPNILLLGQKPHEELPRYIQQFDLGIIPYRLTEYTENVYPTKLNEYHAMGKPVVSTPLPEVLAFNRSYENLVRIGQTAEDFHFQIEQAIEQDTGILRQRRTAASRDNSWNHRIEKMQGLIQQAVEEKAVQPLRDWRERLGSSLRGSRLALRWALGLFLLALAVFKTPLVWVLAEPLVVKGEPRHCDAVVVFAGGVGESGQGGQGYQGRVKQAVELYAQGYAPNILYVSGYTETFQEADVMQALTESLGIPKSALLREKEVGSTLDYCLQVREWAKRREWRSILLVTSPYHVRRAILTFSKNAPELQVIPVPLESSPYYAHELGISPHQILGILHEVIGILVYWARGWI